MGRLDMLRYMYFAGENLCDHPFERGTLAHLKFVYVRSATGCIFAHDCSKFQWIVLRLLGMFAHRLDASDAIELLRNIKHESLEAMYEAYCIHSIKESGHRF